MIRFKKSCRACELSVTATCSECNDYSMFRPYRERKWWHNDTDFLTVENKEGEDE